MNVHEENAVAEATACVACGLPAQAPGKATPLCTNCRTQFINYPVPLWIKIFGGLLLCVLLFSLFTLPKNIQTGIHYKRGLVAADEKNFMTAEKEFAAVVNKEPGYLEANCQLLIASFYNNHFSVFIKTSEALEGKNIEDQELFNHMQSLLGRAGTYFPKDSFVQVMQRYQMNTDSIPEADYKTYLSAFPEDKFALARYAGVLFDHKQIRSADSIANYLLGIEPSFYGALVLKASLKREQMEYDSSLYYINRMLAVNRQDVVALSSKARTLLKEKKDSEALSVAKQAVELDGQEAYALVSLAIAYHYNKDTKSRDAVLNQITKDTSAAGMLSYAKNIISGKEFFRN